MAAGQTVVTFGDWKLLRCQITQFEQTPVWDDVSQTDIMFHRFMVRVVGYIHGEYAWCIRHAPFVAGGSAATNHIAQRTGLQARQAFSIYTGCSADGGGGTPLLVAFPHPNSNPEGIAHLDCNNGPRCKEFRITHVAADSVWRVEAEFEVCKVECFVGESEVSGGGGSYPGGNNRTTGILSNRWTCIDSIDANLRTVRTYDGCLRVASSNLNPNNFRFYVVPPLQPGLRRDRIQFMVTPDGLNLKYNITDTEVMQAAPYPATSWSIRHSETSGQAMLGISDIDITLTGPRTVDKGALITIGMNVIDSRLIGIRPGGFVAKTVKLNRITVTDFIGDEMTINVTAQVEQLQQRLVAWNVVMARIGRPLIDLDLDVPDYNSSLSAGGRDGEKPPYEGPVMLIGAFLPYLQSPCSNIHKIVPDGLALADDENEDASEEPSTEITAIEMEDIGEEDDTLSESMLENIYSFYQMESKYKSSQGKVGMPVANSSYGVTGASTKYVTMSRPQSRQIVRITAERVEEFPEMPSGEQLGAFLDSLNTSMGELPVDVPLLERTFLWVRQLLATPFYNAGNQKMWRLAYEYCFGLNRAPLASEKLSIGKTPWKLDSSAASNATATEGWTP